MSCSSYKVCARLQIWNTLKIVFDLRTILMILFHPVLHEKPHHPRTKAHILRDSMLFCNMDLWGLVAQESNVCINSCVCDLSHGFSIPFCWVLLLQKRKELVPMTHQECHTMTQINDEFVLHSWSL